MDPATLALTAVRLVAPYARRVISRAAGQVIDDVADDAEGRVKALFGLLRARLRNTPGYEPLKELARRPDDPQAQDEVNRFLQQLIAQDPAFGVELTRGVERAQTQISYQTTNVARDQVQQQSGQGNVQVRGENVFIGAPPSQSVPLSRAVLDEMRRKEQELHHVLNATLHVAGILSRCIDLKHNVAAAKAGPTTDWHEVANKASDLELACESLKLEASTFRGSGLAQFLEMTCVDLRRFQESAIVLVGDAEGADGKRVLDGLNALIQRIKGELGRTVIQLEQMVGQELTDLTAQLEALFKRLEESPVSPMASNRATAALGAEDGRMDVGRVRAPSSVGASIARERIGIR